MKSLNLKTTTIIYWLFAVVFMSTSSLRPYPMSFLIKAIPAFTLGILALSKYKDQKILIILGVGFILSSIGDIFLDLNRSAYFLHALVSFLLAHVCYALYYFFNGFDFKKERLFLLLTPLIMGTFMGVLLFSNLGSMKIPVLAYMAVIMVMAVGASMSRGSSISLPLGAIIFMTSDSLIACNKFYAPLSWSPFVILATYYLGHYLMANGIAALKK